MASLGTQFPLGVYVGGPNGSDASVNAGFDARYGDFKRIMGADAQFMGAYIDQGKPIWDWASNASWTAWSWSQDSNARFMTPIIGMPMTSTAMGLSAGQLYRNFASGQYDDALRGMVRSWADQGFRTQYWRPGWEMNVPSMPSHIGDDSQTQADWIRAFQHISYVLHDAGRQGGVDVQVMWNPNVQNWNATNPLALYPGNQHVDVIAADMYDNIYPYSLANLGKGDGTVAGSFSEWVSDADNQRHYYSFPAATQWSLDESDGHSMSLLNLLDFARQQGKPFAIPETGAGGSGRGEAAMRDDPVFPQWLATTLAQSGLDVRFVAIWNVDYNGDWSYSAPDDTKPNEAAAWAWNFGAGSGGHGAPSPQPAATTAGPGADVLVLTISEDAWQGDAQFNIAIDGTTISGVQTATASRAAGASQIFSFTGNWGTGPHTVGITFINDAWGGTPSTDRNLHVEQVAYNGITATGAPAALWSSGTAGFTVPGTGEETALAVRLTELPSTAGGQAHATSASAALMTEAASLGLAFAEGAHG